MPTTPLPFPAKSVRFAAEASDVALQDKKFLDIVVLGLCGDEMAAVHASEDCIVATLKTAIAAQSSVPIAGQKLILGSFILEDDSASMSEVLEASCCVGEPIITLTLVVVPVDPFPKLYIDPTGTQMTAQRAEQTPKTLDFEDFEDFLAGVEFPWALECKECDGPLQEKTRDYDFPTPCRKANYVKVSACMWCPACRLVFKGLHKVVM
jgi:hypothetical protein